MALRITDKETERLARVLAAATGESLTEAIRRALEERRRSLPAIDGRVDEELLGYDAHGMPL